VTATATTAVIEEEHDRVRLWNEQMMLHLGINPVDAEMLSHTPGVDWHDAARLLDAGCPAGLLIDILL